MIHFVFSDKTPQYGYLKYDNMGDYTMIKKYACEYFNITDPICYLPTYKGIPFKQEFLWEYTKQDGTKIFYFPIGISIPIWRYFKDNKIPTDGIEGASNMFKNTPPHSFDEFKSIVDSWGLKFPPRPYQYEAAYKILQWKRSISSIATRAGKTLISYIIFRYAMTYMNVKKILMIVPGIDLVKQGFSDFQEYGEFFNSECLWSGGKVVESSNLTIATFQTLINYLDKKNKKYNPQFFDGYDLVFVDETHKAKASSIKTIIEQPFMKYCKLAYGMSGTLPKEGTIDRWCVHSLLGTKIQEITPRELMNDGYLSDVQIYQHRISYKDKEKQLKTWIRCAEYSLSEFDMVVDTANPKKKKKIPRSNPEFLIAYQKTLPFGIQKVKDTIYNTYVTSEHNKDIMYKEFLEKQITESTGANMLHTEIMMVHFFQERIQYMINIIKDICPRNTLILAQHVEYIKYIGECLKKEFGDTRPVVVVHGTSKDRKKMKDIFKENENVIMVANYAVVGTGITLSNLCHGILFESFKSNIINLQGIGRGLALVDGKSAYQLHDITDCFDKDTASNKIFLQGLARIKIYKEQQFPFNIIKQEL